MFEEYSNNLFKKEAISEREFIDFCLLATDLIDTYWNKRQGMAYHITGAWLKYKNINEDDLLDQIGGEFGNLETPDAIAAGTEEQVRKKWKELKKLVKEADGKFLV